jgi:hypothetical protein
VSWGERAAEQYEKDQPSETWWRWTQNPIINIKDEGTHDHDDHDED